MDTTSSDQHPIDLTSCDQEPIRIPGSIQPHGFMLAVCGDELRIVQVSDNVIAYAGKSVEQVLNQTLAQVIGDDGARQVQMELGQHRPADRPGSSPNTIRLPARRPI